MNHLKSFLVLLLFAPILVKAQNYKTGYVVTQKGDTVKGYIDLKEWNNNPTNISFKKEITAADQQKFTVDDINYFEVAGICSYRVFKASISTAETNIQKLETSRDTSTKTEVVFLKTLQTGKYISLFSYIDGTKARFYVYDKNNKSLTELIFRIYFLPGVATAKSEEAYKQQLYLIAQQYKTDNEDLKYLIENATYLQPTIEKICKKINADQIFVSQNKTQKGNSFKFTVGGGISYITISGSGTFPLYINNVSSSSFTPFISAGVNFYPVPQVSSSLIRLEVMYYKVKNKMEGNLYFLDRSQYWIYTFEQSNICIYPQIQVSVYNTDPLKIYVNAGLSYNYAQYSGNNIYRRNTNDNQSDQADFLPSWGSVPIKIGAVLKKHLNCSLSYAYSSSITNIGSGAANNGFNNTFKEQSLNLGISYIF